MRRRARAPKLPTAAMLVYRVALRRALVAQQKRLWAIIERSYVPRTRDDSFLDTLARMAAEDRPELLQHPLLVGRPQRLDAPADGGLAEVKREKLAVPEVAIRTVATRVIKKTGEEAKRLFGITREAQGFGEKQLAAFRRRNLDLIKSLERTQVDELGGVLKQATKEGWPIERLRRAVQERFEVARSHADLIARDQTLKLNAQLQQARQTAVGIKEYTWSTSNDERVREEHAALDGQRFSWDDPPESGPNGEQEHPGQGISCRCVAIPVVPWLEDE